MDSPNKSRLRVIAVIGATALAGLVGSTMASAVGGSGSPVVEGAATHAKVVVPDEVWKSKCDFFVDQAQKADAAKAAAEAKALKAEKIAKAKAKAKAEKAAKAKAAKLAALKAQKEKEASDADHSWRKHHRHHEWNSEDKDPTREGGGCDGRHDGDGDWGDDGTKPDA